MSKRIRKKKIRMQLIKALEKMGEGEGVVIVNGCAVKFHYGHIELPTSYSVDPDVNIYASMKETVKIRNQSEVWSG